MAGDPNIGQLTSSTWEAVVTDEPVDNVFTSQGLLYQLGEDGFKKEVPGGSMFEADVEYAVNTTAKSYGEFDQLDMTRVTVFDGARYPQKIFAATIQYSDLEVARNQEPNRKFDLVERKVENGKNSCYENLNAMLYGDGTGNGGLDWDGLAKLISNTPTTGTVGGINRANFPFWRSRQTSGAKTATAFDNLQAAMRSIYDQCSLGGVDRAPTGLISDRASFEGYLQTLVSVQRLVRNDGKAQGGDGGFILDAIAFNGKPYIYDETATAAQLYFINNQFLKLCYLKGYWMKMSGDVEPTNMLGFTKKIETFGDLITSASRHLGVVTAIS